MSDSKADTAKNPTNSRMYPTNSGSRLITRRGLIGQLMRYFSPVVHRKSTTRDTHEERLQQLIPDLWIRVQMLPSLDVTTESINGFPWRPALNALIPSSSSITYRDLELSNRDTACSLDGLV